MISAREAAVQRRITARFIEADVLEVVLWRAARVPDGQGGEVLEDPVALPAQRMRLIPLGDGAQERFTADGKAVTPSYKLLGTHDADMQRWDTFVLEGHRYEVVFISQNRQYETKGEVVYHG